MYKIKSNNILTDLSQHRWGHKQGKKYWMNNLCSFLSINKSLYILIQHYSHNCTCAQKTKQERQVIVQFRLFGEIGWSCSIFIFSIFTINQTGHKKFCYFTFDLILNHKRSHIKFTNILSFRNSVLYEDVYSCQLNIFLWYIPHSNEKQSRISGFHFT